MAIARSCAYLSLLLLLGIKPTATYSTYILFPMTHPFSGVLHPSK
jgi:hypothetical protein